MTLLEIINRGNGKWGKFQQEYDSAFSEAKELILEAKEPLDIRTKLLDAILRAKYGEGSFDEAINHIDQS